MASPGALPPSSDRSDSARGPLVTLRAERIASGGGCVAHAEDGRVVFVRHCLPGELVRAEITATTANFSRADAVEILEGAAARVTPPCPHAGSGRCGGCDYQHVAVATQRELKAALVEEQLRRVAHLEMPVTVEEAPGSADGLGWRTRIRFAVTGDGTVGLRRHRSRSIEVLDACPIASGEVEALGVERLRWRGAAEVEAFSPSPSRRNERLVMISAGRDGVRPRELPTPLAGPCGVVVEQRVVREPGAVYTEVLGHEFRVSAGVFWQVHRAAPLLLATTVLEQLAPLPGERVLDLFAGAGLFSVLLAASVGATGEVIAIERQLQAAADARHNGRELPQLQVLARPVTPTVLTEIGSADLVVLDPPREGAGRALTATIVGVEPSPRRVAYVSCDASSFARDLRVALDADWRLTALRAFDLFPMTEHVELVGILEPPAR